MTSSGSGAPPLVLVFGLQDAAVRWLTAQLRQQGVIAVPLPPDLPTPAAQSICSAADAGIHLVSAKQGMDGRYLEYWQLLAEAGKARLVAVHDLAANALDLNEVAAIATRVLEEDVLVTTLPLLDDDEAVMGVLDVMTGEQWFPDGSIEQPRDDFSEAIELETNTLYDEADALGESPGDAIRGGMLAAAVTLDAHSAAGVRWLARHLPPRAVPAASTVLPGDDPQVALVTAGPDALAVGPAIALAGTSTSEVRIESLAGLLAPALLSQVEPGGVAAARITPVPAPGSLLVGR